MSTDAPDHDFDIHIDPDCIIPAMEEATHIDNMDPSAEETIQQPTATHEDHDPSTPSPQSADDTSAALETAEAEQPEEAAADSVPSQQQEPEPEAHEADPTTQDDASELHDQTPDAAQDAAPDSVLDQPDEHNSSELVSSEQSASEYESSIADADLQESDIASLLESTTLDRRHSLRTEALIQAAARAVVSMRQDNQHDEDESMVSYTTEGDEDADTTVHRDADGDAPISRPGSSASSPTEQSSDGDAAESRSHHGTEDDVFSDRSPRSSINSADERFDDDAFEQMTEKGEQSPQVRSRVVSGVSASGESAISDFSRLSRYEKEDFIPTSRSNRPAFRSPSSVRAIQMSSPTPSISSPKSAKRSTAFPTISRIGSPSASAQYSPKGRPTTKFKRQEAPLVLLHVTLLSLHWTYGGLVNHFETQKVPPAVFTSEGMKNLRGAWRQLQDRLGDTVLERGILLPHPQNDYEVLEERLLEALELPLRRRARILECGHYLGPEMTNNDDDTDVDSEDLSDSEDYEPERRVEKRHWCKTCKGDIQYEELGSDRIFRVKVYASNGLMSPGAWEACWKEMERVDIEVEPIIDSGLQSELSELAGILEQEQRQQMETEQAALAEEQQRLLFEEEQRLALEEERQRLEAQRQQLEEERRRTMEDARKELEEQRRAMEQEQRERLEEERRQKFEEERQLLDAQRQQFEEQRLELEMQRKIVEEEQRQHLEEARRQELEEEQRQIEEQRQQLEEARQQFEEERRQRLEEEELRRMQREEDEAKQESAPRSFSRNSYVEDELSSPSADVAATTDIDGRRRDSDRMREIYGDSGRSPSSENTIASPSPAIHIHVDSGRQREEEQNSRQLATIPAVPQAGMQATQVQEESRQAASFMPPSPAPSAPEQTYQQPQVPRKALETASLPELMGETIRILLQDPKNVAIAVLVVLIAMLAGQFTRQEERGLEVYKPQHYQSHHQQLDGREPVGQVIMNTPVVQHHTVTQQVTQQIETVYKTVTAEAPPQYKPSYVPQDIETIYETVTRIAQETPVSRVVETVYKTVTPAAPEVASEFPSAGATPSVDLQNPFAFDSPDPPNPGPELYSDAETLKTTTATTEGAAIENDTKDATVSPTSLPVLDEANELDTAVSESEDTSVRNTEGGGQDGDSRRPDAHSAEAKPTSSEEASEKEQSTRPTNSVTTTASETVTETVVEIVTKTRAASTSSLSEATAEPINADSMTLASDVASETSATEITKDVPSSTYTETVRVTSTVEVDA